MLSHRYLLMCTSEGVSCAHHLRSACPPLNPIECGKSTVIQHKHAGFQALWVEQRRLAVSLEGLTLVTIMPPTITREEVWRAFRHTPAGRRRARDPWVVVVLDGQPCPEGAPWWYRDEETMRHGRRSTEAVCRGPRAWGDQARVWTTPVGRPWRYPRVGGADGRQHGRQRRHDLGVRWRRLRHRHLQAQPAEPAAVRAEVEARLAAWPEAWAVLCVEEAPVRRPPTRTAPWGVVDEGPEGPTGADPTQGPG
jgi:hypothetical protein